MSDALKVLGSRVDALTLGFRVTLDPAFTEALRVRGAVAAKHGRASFEWSVRAGVPWLRDGLAPRQHARDDGGDLEEFTEHRRRRAIWGELRYSRAARVWNIINEPFHRLHIDAQAPGATDRLDDVTGERITEGGWSVEVVFYAQHLAEITLEAALREGLALASMCGEVHEQRLRRIDLCADVAGWTIGEEDVTRLVKRPRAKWSKEYGANDGEPGAQDFGAGSLDRRTITGISVGRGGAMMARIYDKRTELAQPGDANERRRLTEEARWAAAGWVCPEGDDPPPVTRVEFQIRGVAIHELGIRDPEIAYEKTIGEDGRAVHSIVTAPGPDGRPVVVGLVGRLDHVWRTCLDWVRLVVLERTASGRIKPVSRLENDARWKLLQEVTFAATRAAAPIQRFRARSAASSAQGLGVALSQAGRCGELGAYSLKDEQLSTYKEKDAEDVLRARVRTLKLEEADRICEWLLTKCGSPMAANVHLAVRANAARLRFLETKEDDAPIATGPPDGYGPGSRAPARRGMHDDRGSREAIGAQA